MSISLSVPAEDTQQELKPRIMIVGVGGAGGNAVNDMIAANLDGVEFLAVNTDAQALQGSDAPRKVQMGAKTTRGLGAGAEPKVGSAAAEESLAEIMEHLDGSNMVFIAAGMGGGTGTGGAPVIAKAARELGILTVGVVTKPFQFEGVHRMRLAEKGIEELEGYVDALIVIPNQNLFRIVNEKTTFAEAFRLADKVLYSGVRGITDLMIIPGIINLDFADIRSVMSNMGKAMMGTGEAEGERRALDAAEAAITNPLLDDTSMKGAKGVLINITGGNDITLFEVDEAVNRIRSEVDEEEAYIIFGTAFDGELEGRVSISVVATSTDVDASKRAAPAVLSAMEKPLPVKKVTPEPPEPESSASEDDLLVPFSFTKPATTAEAKPVEEVVVNEDVEPSSATVDVAVEGTAEDVSVDTEHQNSETIAKAQEPEAVEEVAEDSVTEETVEESTVDTAEDETGTVAVEEESTKAEEPEQKTEEKVEEKTSPAPAAMPSVDARETFIPPAPVSSDGTEKPTPSNPFAVSDMMNGSSNKPTAAAGKPNKSLLDRIMGAGKNADTSNVQPMEDWQGKTEAPAETATGQADINRPPEPQVSETPSSARTPPRLGGMEPAERNPVPEHEEDLLDIPAFLRRQAN